MSAKLVLAGTAFGGSFSAASSTVSMVLTGSATAPELRVADYTFSGMQDIALPAGGTPQVGAPDWMTAASYQPVNVEGSAGSLPADVIAAARDALRAGETSGLRAHLGQDALQANAVTLLAVEVGGQDRLYAAAADGAGITGFAMGSGTSLGGRQLRSDTGGAYADKIADLAYVETESDIFLFAGSASEHGITAYRINDNGSLGQVDALGRDDSLPVQAVSALETAQVAGRDFLVVAASGSSSLTVLEVGADGAMDVTDHVIDGLDTRFQGVAQLEVVQHRGQAFVLAAGMDDGLSLFQLSAEGRLVHLHSLADSVTSALDGVSGLGAVADAEGFSVLTTASGEAGLSHFRVDLNAGTIVAGGTGTVNGGSGADLLSLGGGNASVSAGSGADIITDGTGADTLRGGAGDDIFVLRADGRRDVIADIEPGRDRLDLSAWGFLYDPADLALNSTSWGGIVSHSGEELELRTADGTSLTRAELASLLPVMLTRLDVQPGPLLVSQPTATQEPFPDSVPAPDPLPPVVMPEEETYDDDPVPPSGGDGGGGSSSNPGQLFDGTDGADSLRGGTGDDILLGRGGNDTLRGGAGNDTIAASDGNDLVTGGDGNDAIGGGLGNDRLEGDGGRDTIGGGQGDDTMLSGEGNDVMSGGPGDDVIEGGAGDDVAAGSFGNDTVQGQDGNDDLGGGTGQDRLTGGAGNDTLGAGEGDDTVVGGDGADFLAGGGRNDRLDGGAGADRLNGGTGDDRLIGGGGADTFIFNTLIAGERDVIEDFQPGIDTLRLGGVSPEGGGSRFGALDIRDAANGVEITYNGHEIVLLGLDSQDVNSGDVLFT